MAVVKFWFQNVAETSSRTGSLVLWLLLLVMPTAVAQDLKDVTAAEPGEASSIDGLRDGDARLLEARLQTLSSYSAAFTQEIIGARGQTLERSTGHVSLLRPAFRWQVDEPYPQIIVADSALVQIYDPDLEQLTIRPMDEALKDTPISLLSRDAVALSGSFTITRISEDSGDLFIVVPRGDETLYAEIRLQFDAAGLAGLGILDHLGQYTQIRFQPDPDSTVIQSSDFQLEVPPGTDVIGG